MNTDVPEFGQGDALRGEQRKLKAYGFYRGTCDGEYREELQLVINRFRARAGRLRQFHYLSTVSGGGNGQPAARQPV